MDGGQKKASAATIANSVVTHRWVRRLDFTFFLCCAESRRKPPGSFPLQGVKCVHVTMQVACASCTQSYSIPFAYNARKKKKDTYY